MFAKKGEKRYISAWVGRREEEEGYKHTLAEWTKIWSIKKRQEWAHSKVRCVSYNQGYLPLTSA